MRLRLSTPTSKDSDDATPRRRRRSPARSSFWGTEGSCGPDSPEAIVDAWARLGAGYLGRTSAATPDLERLILATAVRGKDDPRTVVLAITWLSRYASLVAEHRLCKAIVDREIPPQETSGLGFILNVALDHARRHDRRRNLERAMNLCTPASCPGPYFTMDRVNEHMRERAARRASDVSLRWNLWVEPLQLRYDALRPSSWVIVHNPDLAFRADFRGDLRATILIALNQDRGAGASISALSRRCGVSRTAVVNAVQDLLLARRVTCLRKGRTCRVSAAA